MEAKKEIVRILTSGDGGWAPYDVFCDWVQMLALSISNSTDLIHGEQWREREKEYLRLIEKYGERKDDFVAMSGYFIQALEDDVSDVLGTIYTEAGLGNKYTGQFFTPFHISVLNAECVIPKRIDDPILLNEPSSGGGGAIIAAAKVVLERGYNPQKCLEFVAQDLDWKCVYMTYIQTSLLGLKGTVVQGDTLMEPFTDLKSYPKQRVLLTPAKKGLLI